MSKPGGKRARKARRRAVGPDAVSGREVGRRQVRAAGRQPVLLAGLMIVVAVLVAAAHWPALSAEALCFDDDQYLTNNPLVQNPSLSAAGRFLSEVLEPSTVGGYYQPLTMISLMLDHATGGSAANLRPFHRTSLALHVCNTLLVIVFIYLLFGRAWVSVAVGLLFGVHPMTVEGIPWVGERKTLLAAFFSLWCLVLYVRYTRTGSWKAYAVCLAMYVLALMSKPTSTMMPVLMLLLDYWPLGRLRGRAVLEKLPFFLLGGLFAVVTVISQKRTAAVVMPGEYAPARTPLLLCHNVVFYLYKMVWPINLTAHYPFPEPFDLSNWQLCAGVIGTCLLIAALLISLNWTRALLTGWLIFFVAIFPTMGVIAFTTVIASDKFAYLPSLGLLLILAWLLGRLLEGGVRRARSAARPVAVLAAVLVLAGSEAIATRRYLARWKDTENLYRHMVSLAPQAAALRSTLGYYLQSRGLLDEAVAELREALRLDPHYRFAYQTNHYLGNALVAQGKLDEAIVYFRESSRLKPDFADAYNNLGVALVRLDRIDEAVDAYKKALELEGDNAAALSNLGALLEGQGRTDEAVTYYEKALRIKPDYAEAHNNLGIALARQGKTDQAIQHFESALRSNPGDYDAHKNLGLALAEQGDLDQAIDQYKRALEIRPQAADGHYLMGHLLDRRGRTDEAVKEYRRALDINPHHAKARSKLNAALAKRGTPSAK